MYCTNCGNELPQGASACGNCATRVPHFPPPPKIENYLIHSIIATLCCCLPIGIVALVYSAQVNSKLAMGDIAGAQAASATAKKWVIAAVVAWAILAAAGIALSLLQ